MHIKFDVGVVENIYSSIRILESLAIDWWNFSTWEITETLVR